MFTPEITVGNLMTILTIVISVVSLIRAWSKDRKHKQSESAGRIRQRAGLVIAKIERFRDISSSLFDELQVTITEADAKLARGTDVIETRDFFWKELWVLRRAVSRRIIDEQIQIAYADLYGYDHRVHKLYVGAIRRLETIDDLIFQMLLNETQSNILSLDRLSTEIETTFHSAQLGNLLRTVCARIENVFRASMDKVVEAFRKEFARLLEATDLEIMKRRVSLGNPDDLFPSMEQISLLDKSKETLSGYRDNNKDLRCAGPSRPLSIFKTRTAGIRNRENEFVIKTRQKEQSSDNWKAITGLGAELKRCDECGITTASIAMAIICIDTMANLCRPAGRKRVTRADFIEWVDTYIECHPDQPYKYRGKDVYAARCAFLHTYGSEAELHENSDMIKFGYHDGGEHKYNPRVDESLVLIGTKSFVNDVMLAFKDFLEKCKSDSLLRQRVEERLPKVLQIMPLPL